MRRSRCSWLWPRRGWTRAAAGAHLQSTSRATPSSSAPSTSTERVGTARGVADGRRLAVHDTAGGLHPVRRREPRLLDGPSGPADRGVARHAGRVQPRRDADRRRGGARRTNSGAAPGCGDPRADAHQLGGWPPGRAADGAAYSADGRRVAVSSRTSKVQAHRRLSTDRARAGVLLVWDRARPGRAAPPDPTGGPPGSSLSPDGETARSPGAVRRLRRRHRTGDRSETTRCTAGFFFEREPFDHTHVRSPRATPGTAHQAVPRRRATGRSTGGSRMQGVNSSFVGVVAGRGGASPAPQRTAPPWCGSLKDRPRGANLPAEDCGDLRPRPARTGPPSTPRAPTDRSKPGTSTAIAVTCGGCSSREVAIEPPPSALAGWRTFALQQGSPERSTRGAGSWTSRGPDQPASRCPTTGLGAGGWSPDGGGSRRVTAKAGCRFGVGRTRRCGPPGRHEPGHETPFTPDGR